MIDIFNHFMPKTVFERVRELLPNHPAMRAFPEVPTLWDVDERRRMMDEFDGLQQVLSPARAPPAGGGAPRGGAPRGGGRAPGRMRDVGAPQHRAWPPATPPIEQLGGP